LAHASAIATLISQGYVACSEPVAPIGVSASADPHSQSKRRVSFARGFALSAKHDAFSRRRVRRDAASHAPPRFPPAGTDVETATDQLDSGETTMPVAYWEVRALLVTLALAASASVSFAQTANRAPLISGTPPTTVALGITYAFTPIASDPDGDPISFSIRNKPAWADFAPATGRITGTPRAADVGT
jgi:hypothetical protein